VVADRTTLARARQRLDERLVPLHRVGPRPPRGWIRAVRDALGMTTGELGRRAGVTQSRVSQLERAEEDGSIKLDTLMRVAEALDCTLVYALVPNTSLTDSVRRQARAKAAATMAGITHTMRLEDQAVDDDATQAQLEDLADRFIDRRGLWSEP
jgi:predicted DNA-binding mobile mystery protein A